MLLGFADFLEIRHLVSLAVNPVEPGLARGVEIGEDILCAQFPRRDHRGLDSLRRPTEVGDFSDPQKLPPVSFATNSRYESLSNDDLVINELPGVQQISVFRRLRPPRPHRSATTPKRTDVDGPWRRRPAVVEHLLNNPRLEIEESQNAFDGPLQPHDLIVKQLAQPRKHPVSKAGEAPEHFVLLRRQTVRDERTHLVDTFNQLLSAIAPMRLNQRT